MKMLLGSTNNLGWVLRGLNGLFAAKWHADWTGSEKSSGLVSGAARRCVYVLGIMLSVSFPSRASIPDVETLDSLEERKTSRSRPPSLFHSSSLHQCNIIDTLHGPIETI
jgi:hypothetical protein